MELLNPMSDAVFAAQTVSYTGTAGAVTGWPAGPEGVLVWCSTDAYIVVGNGVTATTANATPLPAGTPVPFKVPLNLTGGSWRVSAIQVANAGTLYAKPINGQ